jgi:hypothetical protein
VNNNNNNEIIIKSNEGTIILEGDEIVDDADVNVITR